MRMLILAAVFLFGFISSHAHAQLMAARKETTQTIIVLADPSLSVPLTQIAHTYSQLHNISITTVYGSTWQHIQDIKANAPANVVISSRTDWIDYMQQNGMINVYSRQNIARNSLVLTGSYASRTFSDLSVINTVMDLSEQPTEFSLNIANPELLTEGYYSLQAIEKNNLEGVLQPYYSFYNDLLDLTSANRPPSHMTMMFYSDTLLFPDLKIVHYFDQEDHKNITYQAVATLSKNMDTALAFIKYLASPPAQKILNRHGLQPIH